MRLDLRYLGASEVRQGPGGDTVRFSPNLARPKVFFDAELKNPVRFREAGRTQPCYLDLGYLRHRRSFARIGAEERLVDHEPVEGLNKPDHHHQLAQLAPVHFPHLGIPPILPRHASKSGG